MAECKKLCRILACLMTGFAVLMLTDVTAEAGNSKNYLDEVNGGVAAILESNTIVMADASAAVEAPASDEGSKLVMANVQNALNVRSEPGEDAPKVGKLYKDCGGSIIERKDGWTKLQSGNIIGWASDEYLLFGEDARELADDVGRRIATVDTETLRVRMEPDGSAGVYGLLPKGEVMEVLDDGTGDWVCIDYEGQDGYVSSEYVIVDFQIDAGETIEEIKAREEAEREAKRHVNYGEYTTDADTTLLLAALIYCEAGGESYEGQLAVGAVVMNRVRSGAYPDSIHGVIYASGQFTPALNGKVNARYESGKISESCKKAAEEALSGVSNVGDCTHFRRNNGREGIVIGNHVFY
ncbi:MAG: cell wall hydrolase [Clostridium sp.]|nr:cell wall hydrolase [Acetatifactor muris]MCM1527863.1 cell wall hydrolase [Bacteroides sp.]MCM1563906.1 cell wall hydrolase [Clostridium sp.]